MKHHKKVESSFNVNNIRSQQHSTPQTDIQNGWCGTARYKQAQCPGLWAPSHNSFETEPCIETMNGALLLGLIYPFENIFLSCLKYVHCDCWENSSKLQRTMLPLQAQTHSPSLTSGTCSWPSSGDPCTKQMRPIWYSSQLLLVHMSTIRYHPLGDLPLLQADNVLHQCHVHL